MSGIVRPEFPEPPPLAQAQLGQVHRGFPLVRAYPLFHG
jgi:hypothetical protein